MVEPVSIANMLPRYLERLRVLSKREKPLRGAHNCFSDLDRFTAALQPGELIVMAGWPSTGKTTLALNIALSAAVSRMLPTAIFSFDLSCNQILSRLIALIARVDVSSLQKGRLTTRDWSRIESAATTLSRASIFVDHAADMSPDKLRRRVLRLKDENGLRLVIVDEFLRMKPIELRRTRNLPVRAVARRLKKMARESNAPVVAVSRLSRRVARRRGNRLELADLRRSGIKHEADMIVSLSKREFHIWGRRQRVSRREASGGT